MLHIMSKDTNFTLFSLKRRALKYMKTFKVKYDADIENCEDIDSKITKFVESELGFKWYAQGYDTETGMRDICFEIL